MFSQVKSLFKHSSVYSLGNMLGKVVSFIMLPVYTRYLTPSDYGIIEMLTLSVSVITMLLSLRLTSALPRFYYGYDDQKRKNTLVSTMLLTAILLSALVAFGLFQGREQMSMLVFKSPDKGDYFGYIFASMVFEIAGQIAFTYLRVLEKSTLFVLVSLLQLILGLALNILFLVVLDHGIMGILYSMVLSNGIVFLVLQAYAFGKVGFGVDMKQLGQILKYSLPLVPASLATFVLNMGDRFMLSRFVDTAEIGVYSLGYKFGVLLGVFVGGPFLQAWEPKRVQLYEQDPEAKAIFQTVFVYMFSLLCFGALGISVLIHEIIDVMAAASFSQAALVTPFVAFGYVFYTIFYVMDLGIMVTKKTYWYPIINAAAAAANVGLNFLLVPWIGILGAAISTAASFFLLPFMGYFVSQRYYPVRYDFFRVAKVGALALAFYGASYLIHTSHVYTDVAIKLVLLSLFPIGLFKLGFFAPEEVEFAKGFWVTVKAKIRSPFG